MRAVSSPSLTDMGDHCQRVPSSNSNYNSSTTTTTSQDDCQATTNNVLTAAASVVVVPVASQNVGVLQKFKRTLTNFNKHQQSTGTTAGSQHHQHQPQHHASTTGLATSSPASDSNNTTASAAPVSGSFLMPDTEMSTSTDVTDASSNKYRFGPLVWRSSKERRKTKYNRRDKCNSGDSGIQIELENDEQFARALATNGGYLNGSLNGGSGGGGSAALMSGRKQEGLVS